MGAVDIEIMGLLISSLLMIIPIAIFWYYKTGLIKHLGIAFIRMAAQLSLVGFYLTYIFELNSWILNFTWLIVMVVAASFTIIRRAELKNRFMLAPALLALIIELIINGSVIALLIIGTKDFFDARYMIPISGMLVGNCLSSAIVGIRSFYGALGQNEGRYRYALMNGATIHEALFPFIRTAMKDAFSPTIANTASIGLIWLPGMMTGQLLGGSDPVTAIKYQIMIIVTIFVGSVLTVFFSINISKKFAFDEMDMFNKNVFLSGRAKRN